MPNINVLLVGGGGGRGGTKTNVHLYTAGGGGEVKEFTISVDLGEKINVTVGAAGVTGDDNIDNATDGGDSYFGELKARGGKRGPLGSTPIASGASGSGYPGGVSNGIATGGGGGNSAAGTNAPNSKTGGNGGNGTLKWGVYYGAGGGGMGDNYGYAGTGWENAGRGGGCHNNPKQIIVALKGIVKVKYLTSDFLQGCIGGTKNIDGDYTIHTFTENGTFDVLNMGGILLWWF